MKQTRVPPFLTYAVAAFAVFAVIAVGTYAADPGHRPLVVTAGLVAVGALTWLSALHRSGQTTGRRRFSWTVLGAGAACGMLANAWTLSVWISALPDEWATASDPLLTLALLLGVAGLVGFAPTNRRPRLARLALDGVVVAGSVLFCVAVVVFPELLDGTDDRDPVRQASLVFLPTLDVAIATIAALLVTRSRRQNRIPLVLLGAGFLCYCVADLTYAVDRAGGSSGLGEVGNLGWVAGYLLFALAARRPEPVMDDDDDSDAGSPVVVSVVLFALFLSATLVLLIKATTGPLPFLAGVVWLASCLATIGRQMLLMGDNESLRRDLEVKVRERTRELEEISRQRELLLGSVGDGIYGVDQRGRITFVNAASASILDRPEESLIGADAHDLFHAPQADGLPFPKRGCYITEAISTGLTSAAETDVYLDGAGRSVPVEVTASPLRDEDGIRGAVVVFRDVTERYEVDRMKGEFVSVVSHELRTPLTSIRGSLGLISAGVFGPLPVEAGRMIDIAVKGTDRLTRLINDILDLERIEADRRSGDLAPSAVAAICEEALTAIAGMAAESGVDVVLGDCSGTVLADRDRVVQTLVNLLGNAIKFSERGEQVRLEARPDGAMVEFAVIDRGRGIPAGKVDDIFTRFTQVDSSDAREKGGSGLGLAISQSIVQRFGGRIWVQSTLGVGSTFRFTIPQPLPVASEIPDRLPASPTIEPTGRNGSAITAGAPSDGTAPSDGVDVSHDPEPGEVPALAAGSGSIRAGEDRRA